MVIEIEDAKPPKYYVTFFYTVKTESGFSGGIGAGSIIWNGNLETWDDIEELRATIKENTESQRIKDSDVTVNDWKRIN